MDVDDHAVHSSLKMKGNVWLPQIAGLASADRHDFRLTARSPAIDNGLALRPLRDDGGASFSISTDIQGVKPVIGGKPDAGALEYDASAG